MNIILWGLSDKFGWLKMAEILDVQIDCEYFIDECCLILVYVDVGHFSNYPRTRCMKENIVVTKKITIVLQLNT